MRYLVVLSLGLLGCGQPVNSPAQQAHKSPEPQEVLASIQRREISLDNARPDAEVSLARNFYFVFDGSGSMGDPPDSDCRGSASYGDKLEGAQWAVIEFLKNVPEDINIGLYVFDNNDSREVVPLGSDNRDAFIQAIHSVRAGGGTPLADSLVHATNQLVQQYKKQLGYGEYRIVVVTDGIAEAIPQAAVFAMEYGIPIYAIGLCVGSDHPLRTYAVSYRAADSFEDLARGLEETLAELPSFDVESFEGDL